MRKKQSRAAAKRKSERRSNRQLTAQPNSRRTAQFERPTSYVLGRRESSGRRTRILITALALPMGIAVLFGLVLDIVPGPLISITTVAGCMYYSFKSAEWDWTERFNSKWLRRYRVYMTKGQWVGLGLGLLSTVVAVFTWKRDAFRAATDYQIYSIVYACCLWTAFCIATVLKITVDFVEIPKEANSVSALDRSIGAFLNGFQVCLVAVILQLCQSSLKRGELDEDWRKLSVLSILSFLLACAVAAATTNYHGVHRFSVPSWRLFVKTVGSGAILIGTVAGIGAAIGALFGAAGWWVRNGLPDDFLKAVGDGATLATLGGAAVGLMTFPVAAIKRRRGLDRTIPLIPA